MARNVQTQAACLLLLLLASMVSCSVLQHQTRQSADPQTQDSAGAEARLAPQRLWKRDTHFPICLFCCGCCEKMKNSCGFCCRT